MKKAGAVFIFMCAIAPAYGVQELELQNLPPLQPLHYCQHSDGHVAGQSEPCASDTTEVSSVSERKPDGTVSFLPLEKKDGENAASEPAASAANEPAASAPAAKEDDQSADVKKSESGNYGKRIAKALAFALVVAALAKLLRQSFVLWLILGLVLRMVLAALHVMAF